MARVLLINPDPVPRVLPPLGISYIAENLKLHGHEPVILDMGFDKEIVLDNIDLVGVTATTLIYWDARKVVKEIKSQRKDIPVVVGGTHASILPDFVLNDSSADCVVIGEGEEVFVDFVEGRREPKGVVQAPIIQDIDKIPTLTYSYLDMSRYFAHEGTDRIRWSLPQPSVAMIGTRGCPFKCTFCASKTLFGGKVRFRSVANIMEEIDFMMKNHDVKSIYFYDDTLTLRKNWMKELCAELKKRKIQWICGTRVDTVNEEMLRMMKDSGCKYISYGVESGSNRMLKDVIRKGTNIEQVESVIKLTDKIGIGIIANYMFGLPGETEEDMKLTLKAVKRIPADAAEFSIFIPLPGTELATGLDWTKYESGNNPYHMESQVHDPEFAKVISYYHKKSINSFYFAPKFMLRQTKLLLKPRQLFYAFKSLIKLMSDMFGSKKE